MGEEERPFREITRLVGVYDADSTLHGELSYWIGARFGRRHCSLCEITHGLVRQRPEWSTCVANLRTPFDSYHRNDQPDAVRAATGDTSPAVVAETDDDYVLLLSSTELDACRGSIEALLNAIALAAPRHRLNWLG